MIQFDLRIFFSDGLVEKKHPVDIICIPGPNEKIYMDVSVNGGTPKAPQNGHF